jgi:hypothetical protein
MRIQVLVRLAAADPWGFTVFDTLKRKLAYDDIVAVQRFTSWELDFGSDRPEPAIEVTETILRETALLVNPNRDRWFLRYDAEGALPAEFWHRSPGTTDAFVVKVTDKEDVMGRSIERILRSRLRIDAVTQVCHSTIWVLEFNDGAGAETAAGEIAVARSWRKGLLANPHCQNAEIHRVDTYFRDKAGSS